MDPVSATTKYDSRYSSMMTTNRRQPSLNNHNFSLVNMNSQAVINLLNEEMSLRNLSDRKSPKISGLGSPRIISIPSMQRIGEESRIK